MPGAGGDAGGGHLAALCSWEALPGTPTDPRDGHHPAPPQPQRARRALGQPGTAGPRWGSRAGGRQTFISRDILHLHVPHLSHVAQHGEDDEAREEAGEAVDRAGDERVPGRQKAGRTRPAAETPLRFSAPPDSAAPVACTPTSSLSQPRVPKPPVKWGEMLSLRPRAAEMWLHGSPRARRDPRLQELTGSSCCGNGCNWPERGGHRTQGPRRRKSGQQHQPKPGKRSNRRAEE